MYEPNYGNLLLYGFYAYVAIRWLFYRRKAAKAKEDHNLQMLDMNNTIQEQGIEIKSIQDTLSQSPFVSFTKKQDK